MKILDKIMYILFHAHYLPRFFSLNVNSFKPKKYLISRYIPYYNDSEIKMQSVFLPVVLFLFVHIQHVVFVISVLPYVVIIHYNFLHTYYIICPIFAVIVLFSGKTVKYTLCKTPQHNEQSTDKYYFSFSSSLIHGERQ